jgi:hypothetical protein
VWSVSWNREGKGVDVMVFLSPPLSLVPWWSLLSFEMGAMNTNVARMKHHVRVCMVGNARSQDSCLAVSAP